jgi:hypothetical protein
MKIIFLPVAIVGDRQVIVDSEVLALSSSVGMRQARLCCHGYGDTFSAHRCQQETDGFGIRGKPVLILTVRHL